MSTLLDSLAGLFGAGIVPRSNADPYGLRRDALGLLATLIGHDLHFSLRDGLSSLAHCGRARSPRRRF